jgi:hypothetical protein
MMAATMATIEIEQRTAEMLKVKAGANGLSLDDYLRRLAEGEAPPVAALDATEIDRILDELAQGGEDRVPLPENFSREEIYFDHD